MKIILKENDEKLNLKLWLPNWFLKTKFIHQKISNRLSLSYVELKKIYKQLKEYVHKNGHFVLLEIDAEDGTFIQIII